MESDDDGVDHEVVGRHLLSCFRVADEFATRVVSITSVSAVRDPWHVKGESTRNRCESEMAGISRQDDLPWYSCSDGACWRLDSQNLLRDGEGKVQFVQEVRILSQSLSNFVWVGTKDLVVLLANPSKHGRVLAEVVEGVTECGAGSVVAGEDESLHVADGGLLELRIQLCSFASIACGPLDFFEIGFEGEVHDVFRFLCTFPCGKALIQQVAQVPVHFPRIVAKHNGVSKVPELADPELRPQV